MLVGVGGVLRKKIKTEMGNCWSGTARGLRRCCCWCGCCPIGPSSSSSYRVDVGVDNAAVAETSICQPVDAVSAATPAPPPPAGNDADADAKELEDELDAELDDMFGGRRRIVPRNAARNAPRRSLPKPPPESLGNRSDSIINGNYGNERKPSSIAPKLASKFGR